MERHVSLSLLLFLLLFFSLVVFDASEASFVREHRKLANSDAEDGKKSVTQDSPVTIQENSDPNLVDRAKKNKEESPATNDNKTQEKGNNGSNSSNNITSPASAPLPKVNGSNGPQKELNKTASLAEKGQGDGKGNEKGDGKGNVKEGGNGNGKAGGEGNGKEGDKGNGAEGGKGNKKDGGKGSEEKGGKGSEKDGGKGNGKEGGKGDGKENNKENKGKTDSQSTTNETCDDRKKCMDNGNMVGCISKLDPTYVVVLLHNGGNDAIKVKPNEGNLEGIEIGTKQTKEVNISLITSERTHLTFNAGKGDCVLHMGTVVPKGDFFVRLPSYDKILTPVNGAYFVILTVLVFGGAWACCKCRKKRHDEVPYQELEMAMPESVAASNMESAEGWDQDWDDDWDDNVAVKSPGTRLAGSISANGLTSRSSNKDGWENNWDD